MKNLVLREIESLTSNQSLALRSYYNYVCMVLTGHAGTGKSFLSLVSALGDVVVNKRRNQRRKIIIIRSTVPTRDIGHLPGSYEEKIYPYEQPYEDIVNYLMQSNEAYRRLKERKYIEFMSTSFIRGLTFDNSVIIVDEIQNMTSQELDSILTRVGTNSKIILCGDNHQTDYFPGNPSWDIVTKVLPNVPNTIVIKFTVSDVIRSDWVGDYLIEKSKHLNIKNER